MALRRARGRSSGSAASLAGILLLISLAGCNGPIESLRSMTGINKNDPDPATAPFTGNLDTAETGSYPNLASVPSPPTVVTTAAERQKLAAELTGQRTSAQANGGTASPGPVPPVPPIPPSIAAPEMASLGQPLPPPKAPPPALRPMDEPPAPAPQNTTLEAPTIASLPGAEAARPAPAPGTPQAIPRPAPSALPPAKEQSGNPLPSPPVPSLPEAKPEPEFASRPPPKLPPVAMTVASLDVPPGTSALPSDIRSRLADVVAQYKERPRTVRVVSYAAPASGGAEQLNSFRAALDRAQIVAKELSDEGIPAKLIQTEASPSEGAAVGRIEVQLLP